MLCPNCSATCLPEDGTCHNCHRPLPRGLRRATVVSWSCGLFAILGALLVFAVVPIKSGADLAASGCVAIGVAFAASCVGGLMGWILGRLICEH